MSILQGEVLETRNAVQALELTKGSGRCGEGPVHNGGKTDRKNLHYVRHTRRGVNTMLVNVQHDKVLDLKACSDDSTATPRMQGGRTN